MVQYNPEDTCRRGTWIVSRKEVNERLQNTGHGGRFSGALHQAQGDPYVILSGIFWVHAMYPQAPDNGTVLFVDEHLRPIAACTAIGELILPSQTLRLKPEDTGGKRTKTEEDGDLKRPGLAELVSTRPI